MEPETRGERGAERRLVKLSSLSLFVFLISLSKLTFVNIFSFPLLTCPFPSLVNLSIPLLSVNLSVWPFLYLISLSKISFPSFIKLSLPLPCQLELSFTLSIYQSVHSFALPFCQNLPPSVYFFSLPLPTIPFPYLVKLSIPLLCQAVNLLTLFICFAVYLFLYLC